MVSLNVHHVIGLSILEDDQSPGHQTLSHITDNWRQSTLDSNIQSPDVMASPSPCDVFKDKDELIVDCQGSFLTNVSSSWFPENTTSILLDNNMLTSVPANFNLLHRLRRLSLSHNQIKELEVDTFRGLEHLEFLNLEFNGLELTFIPNKTFAALKNLTVLFMRQDGVFRDWRKVRYDFLSELGNLESLTISSYGETVHFDVTFSKLKKMKELEVTGEAIKITNSSFENLSQLRVLSLIDMIFLLYLNSSAFRPLVNIQNLSLTNVQSHLHRVFDSFQCFISRKMASIQLVNVRLTHGEQYSSLLSGNGILTPNSTRYLRQICVSQLVLKNCAIFIIESNALASQVWSRCLKSIDLTDNPILGTKMVLFQVLGMKSLETILFRNALPPNSKPGTFVTEQNKTSDNWSKHRGSNQTHTDEAERNTVAHEASSYTSDFRVANQDHEITIVSRKEIGTASTNRNAQLKESTRNNSSNKQSVPHKSERLLQENGEAILYVSKSIKHFVISRVFSYFTIELNFRVIGAEHVLYLDLSDGGGSRFNALVKGLTGLRTFLLSGNDLFELNAQFFDTMPSLQALDLSGCNLNREQMSSSSERLFLNLQNLQQLDLSFNSLTSLSSRTFSSNPNLFEIRLSGNRFRAIPFDLTITPFLKLLDLSSNALISISAIDRRELDTLAAGNGGLRLFLDGNVLSCGCMDIQFLHWLQMTTVELDMARNYSCIDNDGVLTNTAVLSDLEAYWRQCWGKMFLSYSLTLFCLLIIGFVLCFFVTKYKTYIISGLLNLFSETFLKKPSNYEIGVFIGYADRDYQFACHDLRQFIEDTLGLRTFIRDRDLLPSTDLASGIIDAINRSWRVLLVVTETFHWQDDWFLYTCRSAISNLTPANPNLIVIMVDSQLRHRLPRDILGAVSEENIIVMNEGRRLKYDVTEKLRTRLLA
ncbi:toll-like receptor 4 [Physella acuta]|uniref:toll-like receptor 4 n=1 Tax=Physella acuta TaxID=109671 RepID=UPI0027DD98DB|nr:toll-like receptor 4 [Physella acuta]